MGTRRSKTKYSKPCRSRLRDALSRGKVGKRSRVAKLRKGARTSPAPRATSSRTPLPADAGSAAGSSCPDDSGLEVTLPRLSTERSALYVGGGGGFELGNVSGAKPEFNVNSPSCKQTASEKLPGASTDGDPKKAWSAVAAASAFASIDDRHAVFAFPWLPHFVHFEADCLVDPRKATIFREGVKVGEYRVETLLWFSGGKSSGSRHFDSAEHKKLAIWIEVCTLQRKSEYGTALVSETRGGAIVPSGIRVRDLRLCLKAAFDIQAEEVDDGDGCEFAFDLLETRQGPSDKWNRAEENDVVNEAFIAINGCMFRARAGKKTRSAFVGTRGT